MALNPEFEGKYSSFKGLTRYQISRGFDENDKRIPQSTILDYTKELEENGCVRRILKTKLGTGKYRITYDLTTLGMIRWFHYLNNNPDILKRIGLNKIRAVVTKSKRLLPFISDNWSELNKIFKNELVVTMTLLWVSDIEISYYDSKTTGSLASAPLNAGYLKIQIINQIDPPRSKKIMRDAVFEKRNRNLAELFTFVYLYTLDRKQPIQDKKLYYENRKKLLSLIKSHPPTYNAYLKFIEQLKTEIGMAVDYIKEIELVLKNIN
ncbi:MAG: hypothetical protein HY223_03350 [Thaumarchaeota archaeon]|nr:hypothetical protein [Nitrososphaerota archaeon]